MTTTPLVVTDARKPADDEIDVYGLTHQGLVRPTNQDHFLLSALGRQMRVHQTSLAHAPVLPEFADPATDGQRIGFLAVVADGLGSSAYGEEASRLAVEAVTAYVARSVACYYAADPGDDAAFARSLEEAAAESHAEILRRAASDETVRGMATTLTLWLGVWPRVYLLQVGDSRYYLFRDGELTQVSRDQTVAQELVDKGVLSRTDAARTRWAHVLSSAIGGSHNSPTVTSLQNNWSSVHLLCSDGLTKHVSDDRIRERLASMTSARQVCEDLLQDALDDGGSDNITIIVGRAVRKA